MSRDLDPTLAAGLPAGVIQPVFLVQLDLKSGTEYVWSGVGDLLFGSPAQTFKGVGDLGSVGPISEGDDVKADGTYVTLSGIGLAQFAQPTPPAGAAPPPASPISPAPAEYIAWAYPTAFFEAAEGTGAANAALNSGSVQINAPFPPVTVEDRGGSTAGWSGFAPPPLPADAVIVGIYPVIVIIPNWVVSESSFLPSGLDGGGVPSGVGTWVSSSLGTSLSDLVGYSASIGLGYSLDGAIFNDNVTASFIGLAIYYDSDSGIIPNPSLLYEALQDIQIGAPAKIWFGLMQDGELLGTPYLVFAGTVDKPTIKLGVDTNLITLALENRLVNLQRATQLRYTAADQHLTYPDDSFFNFVEILQDIALVWGGSG